MKGTLSNIVIFAVGAAIGSAVTYKYVKNKYEQILQEEIDSVKEVFSRRNTKEEETDSSDVETVENEEANDDDEEARNDRYHTFIRNYRKEEDVVNKDKPYVISPESFDEHDDYDIVSLTYYADGVLTDEADKPLSDEEIEANVGRDSLKHFGEYEEDSVFVRNDSQKCDYEILKDLRNYSSMYPQDTEE